jgi:hypothetical protein
MRCRSLKDAVFQWRAGYSWLPALTVRAQRFFAHWKAD